MPRFDEIIPQPLRLRIMSALNALPATQGMEFSRLKKLTGATDGNLGAHIETLAKAGYVAVDKAFVGKRPQTTVTATAAGRGAFARHVATLQEIIAASALVTKLWCAPGNAGIAREAECVALEIADHAAVIDFCKRNAVELVVVGPETPLAAGIVDDLTAAGIKAFGPSKAAAQLEGSKGFTKDLCREFDIPTGAYRRFDNATDALAYVRA